MGRSDAYASAYDLEAENYVPLPKGEVHKRKDVMNLITLADIDDANSRPPDSKDLVGVMGSLIKRSKTEMTDKLRTEVNRIVKDRVDKGLAEVIPGVVFIDEVWLRVFVLF